MRRALAVLAVLLLAGPARAQTPPPQTPAETGAPAQPVPAETGAPAAPVPAPSAGKKPEASRPQNLEKMAPGVAVPILGRKVLDAAGKDMGPIVDVLVDRDGLVRAAVIDFGGFLGVGSRKIAIDWRLLQFNPHDRDAPVELALDRAEVQAAPEYKPSSQPAMIVGPPPSVEGGSVPTPEK
ncbi:MAG TPA: PRC-barrel domain-containing protein [Stellaceae bacterium]|nr:PRC-barrel domain-containing protein [Stellaceae bacterium]